MLARPCTALRAALRRDDGAAAVEAALVTPLILLLLIGIVEFAFLLKADATVSAAVRAGVRSLSQDTNEASFPNPSAVARAVGPLPADDMAEATLWLFDAGTIETPDDDAWESCSSNCVKFSWDSNSSEWEPIQGSWDFDDVQICAEDVRTDMGVRMEYPHDFVTGLFGGGPTLSEMTIVPFEPQRCLD